MDRIKIGQITNAVGIKGELRVYPYTDTPRRFSELKRLYVEEEIRAVTGVRYMKNLAVLSLEGVKTRNDAEALKGRNLYINREDMWELEEDAYLIKDLLGLDVYGRDGSRIGRLERVVQNSSQDLYEIEEEDGSRFLLPAVKEFILDVDLEAGRMTVKLIEGLRSL